MLPIFGCRDSNYYKIRESEEFDKMLGDPVVIESWTPQFLHCYLGETDCPAALAKKARICRERNRKALAKADKEFGRRRNLQL